MKIKRFHTSSKTHQDRATPELRMSRSQSATPQYSSITYNDNLRTIFHQQINAIRPFAHIERPKNIDDNLNKIIELHKKVKDSSNSTLYSSIFQQTKKKPAQTLHLQCQQIINWKRKIKHHHNFIKNKEVRSTMESYDDIQCDIADAMIKQSKRDKVVFNKTLQKFKSIIDSNLSPKQDSTVHKNKTSIDHIRHQYTEENPQGFKQTNSKKVDMYDLNKADVFSYLKSVKKIINSQVIPKSLSSIGQTNGNGSRTKRRPDQIYGRYCQSRKQRKNILKAPLTLV